MNDFNNRGLLFKNSRKWRPKHPDLTGEAIIGGRKFKLAAWMKQGRRGEFYSVAFTEELPAEPEQPQPEAAPPSPDTPEDYAF